MLWLVYPRSVLDLWWFILYVLLLILVVLSHTVCLYADVMVVYRICLCLICMVVYRICSALGFYGGLSIRLVPMLCLFSYIVD
jgi:hypothetical protein